MADQKYDHEIIKKLLLSGKSVREVAAEIGAPHGYVTNLRKRKGWYLPGYKPPKGAGQVVDKLAVKRLHEQGYNGAEIAARVHCHPQYCRRIIREKLWEKDDQRKNRRKIDYDKIYELVQQGYTARAIAGVVGSTEKYVSNVIEKQGWRRGDVIVGDRGQQVQVVTRRLNVLEHMENLIETFAKLNREVSRRNDLDDKIVVAREFRKQLMAYVRIEELYLSIKDVAKFQEIVLDVVGKASPSIQNEIYERLARRRAIGIAKKIKAP